MCGRFTLLADNAKIEDEFGVILPTAIPPLYNIAPTQPILTIKSPESTRSFQSNLPPHMALLARWGFIPAFVKEPDKWPLTINIRAETVHIKKSFKNALNHRRILIPASGFFEWKRRTGKENQPYYIYPQDKDIIGLAGLMESWSGADGTEIDTAGIITIAANDDIKAIHHRMPVIITKDNYNAWLDVRNYRGDEVLNLLKPMENGRFAFQKISTKVNNINNRTADILEPLKEPEAKDDSDAKDDQLSLF